jgi:hypothetical protein
MSAGEGKSLPEISEIGVPNLSIKAGAFILSSIFLVSISKFMLFRLLINA